MPYRSWLPLLLMAVLVLEGIFGAWAGTRMAVHAMDGIAAEGDRATTGCEVAKRVLAANPATAGHPRHDPNQASAGRAHQGDCTCVSTSGCECRCVLSLYPPVPMALLATAHSRVSLAVAPPAVIVPTSKLSRVFRPPIA